MRRGALGRAAALCGACAAALGGCVTENPRPARTAAVTPPSGSQVTELMVAPGAPEDTDANGFVDTVRVVVYLFHDPARYPAPMYADGSLTFMLRSKEGREMGRWEFPPEAVARGRVTLSPGPAQTFTLRLLERGSDATAERSAILSCTFKPVSGPPVEARSQATLVLGRGR